MMILGVDNMEVVVAGGGGSNDTSVEIVTRVSTDDDWQ